MVSNPTEKILISLVKLHILSKIIFSRIFNALGLVIIIYLKSFLEIFKLLKSSYFNVVIGNGFEKNPLSFRYCEFLSASFFSRRTKVIVFDFLIHQLLV